MEITEIILSGGHIYAISFLGALKNIDHSKIKRYVGTSAGAIIGLFMVLGFSPERIEKILLKLPLDTCFEISSQSVLEFLDKFGTVSTDRLIKLIGIVCKHVGINPNSTFLELYEKRPIELSIIAYSMSDRKSIEFSYLTTPEMSVLKAIQMTIAIPILFKPVIYNHKVYIDGGVIDNLPWRFVHNKKNAVGITVRGYSEFKKVNVLEYIYSIIDACRCELDDRIIENDKDKICIIRVPVWTDSWLLGYHPAIIKDYFRIGQEEFRIFLNKIKGH
tara:strand:+ start:906 stop:1730 length:825 start_codon:yes stop_codon:yes gene_type:complete